MGYRITLDRGVLRAELFGRETVEQTKAFFKAVVSASRETGCPCVLVSVRSSKPIFQRSEEHTSELQSLAYLVCRLLLEKKKDQPKLARLQSALAYAPIRVSLTAHHEYVP